MGDRAGHGLPDSVFVVALSRFSALLAAFACWPVVELLTFSGRFDLSSWPALLPEPVGFNAWGSVALVVELVLVLVLGLVVVVLPLLLGLGETSGLFGVVFVSGS